MKTIAFILTALAATLTAASPITTEPVTSDATDTIRYSLMASDRIYVYEGLPHQRFESALLEKEKKRKDTTEIGGFPLYTPKQIVPDEAARSLRAVLAASASLAVFSGEKRCGGFHPDYAVAWEVKGQEYAVLICYGCGEVLYVAGSNTYRYNLSGDAKNRLKKLLAPFAKKRPDQTPSGESVRQRDNKPVETNAPPGSQSR